MRRAARIDATQREIVETLQAGGCRVRRIQSPEAGTPDLMVLRQQAIWDRVVGDCAAKATWRWGWSVVLVECKTRTGKLRAAQIAMQNDGWPVIVLRSAEEAAAWLRGK